MGNLNNLKSNSNLIFIILGILLLLGSGLYLAYKNFTSPKFRILPIEDTVPQMPQIKNQDYLDKLIAKDWYWVETIIDGAQVIKPYSQLDFKLNFRDDLSFSSSSDCNNIGGSFEIFEKRVRFKNIFKTEKYCMKSNEDNYLDSLSNVSEISFNEKNELILKYRNSNSYMKFR
jgi:heat shock protein HslJ